MGSETRTARGSPRDKPRSPPGYTVNHHHAHVAVYDINKCIEVLVDRDGMSHEEADEFLSFNTLGAFVGENGPIYIRTTP